MDERVDNFSKVNLSLNYQLLWRALVWIKIAALDLFL